MTPLRYKYRNHNAQYNIDTQIRIMESVSIMNKKLHLNKTQTTIQKM